MATVPPRATPLALLLLAAVALAGCGPDLPVATPPISPGTGAAPREVNIIAREYSYQPPVIDFVPGETVLIHVVNAGLEVHEVVIGNMAVQDAWEAAEAATIGAPPGPTPVVSVPPGLEGVRVVVRSGERVDVTWSVPAAAPPGATPPALIVGCHIPGHWAKGMLAAIRLVTPGGEITPGG
jgi:uncharacterized cupredoxin-like copper-binding protein